MAIGKWIGGALGWILAGGNILGAVAGFCIGSMLDEALDSNNTDNTTGNGFNGMNGNGFNNTRPYEEARNSFLFSMLVLSSYVIKADGKIMHSEMEYVRQFLRQNFGEQSVQQGESISYEDCLRCKSSKDLISLKRQSAKAV